MRLTIEIDMDGAAFSDGNATHEVRRILMRLCNGMGVEVMRPEFSVLLRDVNGNAVGLARVDAKGAIA